MNKNIFKYDDMKRSEHMAVRNSVGWYLWTHHLLEITGADVTKFLDYIFPNDIGSLSVGKIDTQLCLIKMEKLLMM